MCYCFLRFLSNRKRSRVHYKTTFLFFQSTELGFFQLICVFYTYIYYRRTLRYLSHSLYKERRKSCRHQLSRALCPIRVRRCGTARTAARLLSFFSSKITTYRQHTSTYRYSNYCCDDVIGASVWYITLRDWKLVTVTNERTNYCTHRKKKHAHTYTLDPGALVTSSWWVQTWKKRKKIKISQVKT